VATSLDVLLRELQSDDVERRRKAADEMIGRRRDPVPEDVVRELARSDSDRDVRGSAVMELYLREARDDEAATFYRRAIADGDWAGVLAGLNGLALVGSRADLDLLQPYAGDPDDIVADTAQAAIDDIEKGGRRFERGASRFTPLLAWILVPALAFLVLRLTVVDSTLLALFVVAAAVALVFKGRAVAGSWRRRQRRREARARTAA
jgi:hypothetical protein